MKEKNAKLSNELKRIKQKFGNGPSANQDPLEVQKFKFENIGGQGNLKENLKVLNDKIKLLQPTNDTKFHFLCKECQKSGKSLEDLKLHLTLKHLEDQGEFTVQHFSGQNGLEIFIKFAKIKALNNDPLAPSGGNALKQDSDTSNEFGLVFKKKAEKDQSVKQNEIPRSNRQKLQDSDTSNEFGLVFRKKAKKDQSENQNEIPCSNRQKLENEQSLNQESQDFQEFKISCTKGNLKKNLGALEDKIESLNPAKDTKFHFLCKTCPNMGKSIEDFKDHLTKTHPECQGELTGQHFSGQKGLEIFIKFVKFGNLRSSGVKRKVNGKENLSSKCRKAETVTLE